MIPIFYLQICAICRLRLACAAPFFTSTTMMQNQTNAMNSYTVDAVAMTTDLNPKPNAQQNARNEQSRIASYATRIYMYWVMWTA